MKRARLRTVGPRVKAVDARKVKPQPRTTDPFYLSPEWRALVADLIRTRGRRCQNPTCNRTHGSDGLPIRLIGDHIVERRDGGADLDPRNVQLLCWPCHNRKTVEARRKRMAAT
jgi:5-methylcytosine-specific restriction endonuclease McrA